MCAFISDWIQMNRQREIAKAAINSAFIGAALGVAAGILFAPQSGAETRADIGEAVQDTWDSARYQMHRVGQGAKNVTDDLADTFHKNRSFGQKREYAKGYAAGFRAALDELSDEWDMLEDASYFEDNDYDRDTRDVEELDG